MAQNIFVKKISFSFIQYSDKICSIQVQRNLLRHIFGPILGKKHNFLLITLDIFMQFWFKKIFCCILQLFTLDWFCTKSSFIKFLNFSKPNFFKISSKMWQKIFLNQNWIKICQRWPRNNFCDILDQVVWSVFGPTIFIWIDVIQ